MAKNTRIGLALFFNNSTNSGIVNYIYNIVAALNTLPEEKQPQIVLLHNETAPVNFIESIGYKKFTTILVKPFPENFILRKINSLLLRVTGINYFTKLTYYKLIDCFYPYFPFVNQNFRAFKNKIEWVVDFNNRAFPLHYEDSGKLMQAHQEATTKQSTKIILSSYALKEELKKYYPNYKNEVKILRFACSLPSLSHLDIQQVKAKHQLEGFFFMSPNQFWEHKNQIVVLQAIAELKSKYPLLKFKVLFTGSLAVNRGKGLYAEKLISAITNLGIDEYVQFLGILDRKEQLLLMQESVAIIQPSLYEGWSTLVEEAKALNKYILLSDLPVHREQIKENCSFFDPYNPNLLAELIFETLEKPVEIVEKNYFENVSTYGERLLEVLQ